MERNDGKSRSNSSLVRVTRKDNPGVVSSAFRIFLRSSCRSFFPRASRYSPKEEGSGIYGDWSISSRTKEKPRSAQTRGRQAIVGDPSTRFGRKRGPAEKRSRDEERNSDQNSVSRPDTTRASSESETCSPPRNSHPFLLSHRQRNRNPEGSPFRSHRYARFRWPAANVFAQGTRKWRERKGVGRKERPRTESHSCAETSSIRSVQERHIGHPSRRRMITFAPPPLRWSVLLTEGRQAREAAGSRRPPPACGQLPRPPRWPRR